MPSLKRVLWHRQWLLKDEVSFLPGCIEKSFLKSLLLNLGEPASRRLKCARSLREQLSASCVEGAWLLKQLLRN